jgi:hypothetical protein
MVTKAVARTGFLHFIVSGGSCPVSKNAVTVAKFIDALIAVLAGNLAYFLLAPHFPPSARHIPFRADIGLLLDFWLCLAAYGVIKAVANKRKP